MNLYFADKQHDQNCAFLHRIDTIAGTEIDPEFDQSIKHLVIAAMSAAQQIDPRGDARHGLAVAKPADPLAKGLSLANLNHWKT